jgi:hypothetical protein
MKTISRDITVRYDFWPDIDPLSMERETEMINRIGREEEYINRMEPGSPAQSVCIPFFVKGRDKPFFLHHDILVTSNLWKLFRKKMIRNMKRCEVCDSRNHLQIHHIKYSGFYEFFDEKNIMVLCRTCHSWVHGLI